MDQRPDIIQGGGDIHTLIRQLEELVSYIEHSQAICNTMFDTIRRDCNTLINDVKTRLPETESYGKYTSTMESASLSTIPIEDRKLQKAWAALARYPKGATAEDIMRDLDRHRTTVSTYLNQLVLLEFAEKERIGHEIYYRAIPYKEEGEKE